MVYELSNYSNLGSTGLTVYFPSIMNAYESSYAQNTTSLVTGQPYFAANYTESTSGLVAKYYEFYSANYNSLVANIVPSSINVTSESISGMVSNNFDTVLAAGGGINNCNTFLLIRGVKVSLNSLLCYSAITNNVMVTDSASARNYNVYFPSTNAGSWPTLNGNNIALIPNQSNFKTYVPGNEAVEYMIPVVLQYNQTTELGVQGYLRVENSGTTYTVIDFQPVGNPAPKSYKLEPNQKYYLGTYASFLTKTGTIEWTWAYLNDSSFTVPESYNEKTNPVILGVGNTSSPSKFTFIVVGLTGGINIGESVNYNY